ncbi:hypothetical protein [Streptomyces sp. NPDC015125]|uniref:hypothetical protein n=1 Tax=Streptomyces sp. NPDC015125 TaxID=3364938 RepID=UPI0036F51ACB
MFTRTQLDSSQLLDYLVTTNPAPLQITPAGVTAEPSTLTVLVSNSDSDPVYVSELRFHLPAGAGASELTEHLDAVHCNVVPGSDWTVSFDPNNDAFVAIPSGDSDTVKIGGTGYAFEFSNIAVNSQVGVVPMTITEDADDKPRATGPGKKPTATVYLGKAPYLFHFDDLIPQILEGDTPRSAIDNGDTVTFTWRGAQGAGYTMMWDNQTADVTNRRSWTSPTLTHDTTFYLKAGITSDGHSVNHYLSQSITVLKPDVEVGTLTVDGQLTAGANVAVSGELHFGDWKIYANRMPNLKIRYGDTEMFDVEHDTRKFTVYGPAELQDKATVSGNVKAGGELHFGGDWKICADDSSNLNVRYGDTDMFDVEHDTKKFTIQGDALLNGALTANSDVRVNGEFSLYGATDMLGNHTSHSYGASTNFSLTAPTDGLLTAVLVIKDNTDHDDNIGYLARLYLTIGSNDFWIDAPLLRQSGKAGQRHPMSFLVRKGQTISGYVRDVDHDVDLSKVSTSLDWYPIGPSVDLKG